MICHIRDTVFKMFLFLSCIYIFSFALCSSVLNVYALDDTEPTAVIKEPENPSELILEEFETEDITELVTPEPTTEELKSITSTAPSVLYLKPNANWLLSNARFAMRFNGDSEVWVSMTDLGNGYYKAFVPSGDYDTFIFLRMDPSTNVNSWTTKWNYSQSLTFPADGSNCFTVTEKECNDAVGVWSTYSDTEEPTEDTTDSDTKENGIDNQKFQNVILLMLFVVFVVTLFIRYV